MNSLKTVLMERDDLTDEEAEEIIMEMKSRMYEGENPEELLFDEGLEPDYIFDLID